MVLRGGRPDSRLSLVYPEVTLRDLVSDYSSKFKNKETMYFGSIGYSWRYIEGFSNAFANVLADLGVGKGSKVGVMLPNTPQLPITLFGVWKAGGIAVLLDPWLGDQDLKPKLVDTHVVVTLNDIIAGYDVYSKLEALGGSARVDHVITTSMTDAWSGLTSSMFGVLADVKSKKRSGTIDWLSAVRKKLGKKPPETPLYPDDVAVINYTGPNKNLRLVTLSHRALIANALQFASAMRIGENDVVLNTLPLVYAFPFVSFLGAAMVGAKNVFAPLFTSYSIKRLGDRSPDFIEALKKYKVTLITGSPAIFRAYTVLADNPELYSGVRAALCLPIPPPEDLKSLFQKRCGIRLSGGYATPEGLITHVEAPDSEPKPHSIGQPLPDTEAAVFQAENRDLPLEDNQVGVLGVRGPQFVDIYSSAALERRKQNLNSTGWLITGDYVERDRQGDYIFVKHGDEVVVTSGQRVWKSDVEEILSMHPAIKSCSVSVEEDVFLDEALVASVEIDSTKGSPTPQELQNYVAQSLALYKVPIRIEIKR